MIASSGPMEAPPKRTRESPCKTVGSPQGRTKTSRRRSASRSWSRTWNRRTSRMAEQPQNVVVSPLLPVETYWVSVEVEG